VIETLCFGPVSGVLVYSGRRGTPANNLASKDPGLTVYSIAGIDISILGPYGLTVASACSKNEMNG
jgi:hypothetical protein